MTEQSFRYELKHTDEVNYKEPSSTLAGFTLKSVVKVLPNDPPISVDPRALFPGLNPETVKVVTVQDITGKDRDSSSVWKFNKVPIGTVDPGLYEPTTIRPRGLISWSAYDLFFDIFLENLDPTEVITLLIVVTGS